jgi:drug/metabolite transporter (DMT)-like permease
MPAGSGRSEGSGGGVEFRAERNPAPVLAATGRVDRRPSWGILTWIGAAFRDILVRSFRTRPAPPFQRHPDMNLKQLLGFLALTIIWGSSFVWIKVAVREIGPLTVVTIRLAFAVVALLGFLIARRPPLPRGVRMWSVLFFQGVTSTALPWILITWAEQYIEAAVAVVLNATVPMFTIVIAHVFLHDDRITSRRLLGLLVGFAGVLVLVHGDISAVFGSGAAGAGGTMVLLGNIAMLLSSGSYAVSNVFARAKLRGVPPIVQAFYTMLLADAVMWAVTPAVEAPFRLPVLGLTWTAVAWLGVLGAGIAYVIFYYLLHSIGPTRISMVTYTIPVVGVALGVVFLDERLDWSLVVGTILIVSGVWGARR